MNLIYFRVDRQLVLIGGPGSEGKVTEVRNYGGDTGARNAVKVKWKNGEINVYKLGAAGKVDLKFMEPGVGTDYYRDHLPVPGKTFLTGIN